MHKYNVTFITLYSAIKIAELHYIEGIRQNKTDKMPSELSFGKKMERKLTGVLGEFALCDYLHVNVPLINGFKRISDVANTEVRTTNNANGKLIIRSNDDQHKPFVLAIASVMDVTLVGWCYPVDVVCDKYWQSVGGRKPCWFIPQKELNIMDTLPDRISIVKQ
jgi:hypothetical protein